MAGEHLDIFTFDYLMDNALSNVPDTVDKRQGSIIYDAIAPACYELAEFYMELRKILENTFVSTATGEYLDLRVAEQGITREQATYAVKKGTFTNASGGPAVIPLGTRFSTISDDVSVNYYALEPYTENGVVVAGAYKLQCETLGTEGNSYTGNLLPLTNIENLSSAIMSDLLIPAQDVESDDDLRERYTKKITQKAFGGNVTQYDEFLKSIPGVGDAQIYPVWDGGGTVKCSIVDTQYNAVSSEFIDSIQQMIDPPTQGKGLGFAPIGHTVTIATPTNYSFTVSATVSVSSGYTLTQLEPSIKLAIEKYFYDLRTQWGTPKPDNTYSISVFISRINASILNVPGVANVTNTKLNGSATDVTMPQSATTQVIPVLGTVTLNE